MNNTMKIDCALMCHESDAFIFPTIALVEVISLKEKKEKALIHNITWKNYSLPLVACDLSSFSIEPLPHEKMAIINALFSSNVNYSPYFALYFNGPCYRKKLSAKDITWINKETKEAEIDNEGRAIKVKVFDLFAFSKKLEDRLSKIA